MNIRLISKLNPRYSEINREERNYAAIFYNSLLQNDNLKIFLQHLNIKNEIGKDFGIYFEYSMLRDLWYKIKDEDVKREIISEHLDFTKNEKILEKSPFEINSYFGVIGEPSKEYIQFPGKWSIHKYNKTILDNSNFFQTSKFKWSFNIKPDIVVHLDKESAICIEAKYESGEGQYPNSKFDKEIFSSRNLMFVGQTELQKFMMEELLGIKTEFVFLVFKKEKSESHKILTWNEAFEGMHLNDSPQFIKDMLSNINVEIKN